MEALPSDIRNLPTYTVPAQLFICTAIVLILLALAAVTITITWIYRSCKHIHNYEYMAGHQFLVYYNKKEERIKQEDPDGNYLASQKSDSRQSEYSMTTETQYKQFNRNQSRFLEFACLSVVVVININSFSCNIFEMVAFAVAVVCFLIFNILRKGEHIEHLRLIYLIPLIAAYIPFYIESKTLTTS